jgi:hypothetical protein
MVPICTVGAVRTDPAPVRRPWFAVLGGYLALGATLQILPTYATHRFHAGPATVGLPSPPWPESGTCWRPTPCCSARPGW